MTEEVRACLGVGVHMQLPPRRIMRVGAVVPVISSLGSSERDAKTSDDNMHYRGQYDRSG